MQDTGPAELIYTTSLEFHTAPGTPVSALARHTGISPDEFQLRKGAHDRPGNRWYVASEAEPDATLTEHLTSLAEAFMDPGDGSAASEIREVVLAIGVHYPGDRATPPMLRFPAELIARIHARYPDVRVAITLNPIRTAGPGTG